MGFLFRILSISLASRNLERENNISIDHKCQSLQHEGERILNIGVKVVYVRIGHKADISIPEDSNKLHYEHLII